MILTTCWVCAAPLDQNWLGKCVRCDTRYCSQACLRQHPDEECRSITRGGGAAQYHADKKYKEAVAVAVETCAEDTAGQTCYICHEAVESENDMLRMCACQGTAGFVHVSCLVEQAKVLVEGECAQHALLYNEDELE